MEICQTDGTVSGTTLTVDLIPGVSTSQLVMVLLIQYCTFSSD